MEKIFHREGVSYGPFCPSGLESETSRDNLQSIPFVREDTAGVELLPLALKTMKLPSVRYH